jgi:hypothetical protein
MSSTPYQPPIAYPLSVRGFFDRPSRALWLIKWLLLIPHYIILAFLWLAFWIVTVIAFFAPDIEVEQAPRIPGREQDPGYRDRVAA